MVYLQCLRASLCMWQIVAMFSTFAGTHALYSAPLLFAPQLHGLGMKFLIHNKE